MKIKLLKLVGGNWREEGKRGWRRRRSLVRLVRHVENSCPPPPSRPGVSPITRTVSSAACAGPRWRTSSTWRPGSSCVRLTMTRSDLWPPGLAFQYWHFTSGDLLRLRPDVGDRLSSDQWKSSAPRLLRVSNLLISSGFHFLPLQLCQLRGAHSGLLLSGQQGEILLSAVLHQVSHEECPCGNDDWVFRLFIPKCTVCGLDILGEVIRVGDNLYHRDCHCCKVTPELETSCLATGRSPNDHFL